MNVSKHRRDELLSKINQIRAAIAALPDDSNRENLLTYLNEVSLEVSGKKYGLVVEEHRERIDDLLDNNAPVLTEIPDLTISGKRAPNFLIEGDNLAALQILQKTHRGKIKAIYIDPPYNRDKASSASDFVYDDCRVDPKDTFRHSKWISFMKPRLSIARDLLRKDGVIFISIDDSEQAPLKILCDEIFGPSGFFCQIVIQSNKRGQTYKQIAKTHEYLLVYTRGEDVQFNEIPKIGEKDDLNLRDDIGTFNTRELRNRNPKYGSHNRPNLFYPIYVNPNEADADGFCPVSSSRTKGFDVEVLPYNSKGVESCWRWGKDKLETNIGETTRLSNVVAKRKRKGGFSIVEKYRKKTYKAKTIWTEWDELWDGLTDAVLEDGTVWTETDVITEKGTVQLGELGLADKFEFPKPLGLIEKALMLGTGKHDLVLDFFAGSGTTGHAVLNMNRTDDGDRRFILCTNNENNICRGVTYERLRRVLEEDAQDVGLKYFCVEYVPVAERLYYEYADELLAHTRELVELENGVSFADNPDIVIVLTEPELNDLTEDLGRLDRIKRLYLAHDVLINGVQAKLFNERDIEICTVPDYYYGELEG